MAARPDGVRVVLKAWGLAGAAIEVAAGGLINGTWLVGDAHVLQRLHPVFAAEVNLDIAALAPVLRARNVPVPNVVPTLKGQLWVEHDGAVWRTLERMQGRFVSRVRSIEQARSAAALLGRFHTALRDQQHSFHFTRPGAHDTERHLSLLATAVRTHRDRPLAAQVSALAEALDTAWRTLEPTPDLPRRLCHGDPKIANFLFDESDADRATALVDLDTMGWGTFDAELGDALRSWCNRALEDEPPQVDVEVFRAAVEGWLSVVGDWVTAAEAGALVTGFERIALELSMRFAADALNDSYFGWDPARAPSRCDHNLLRARSQYALARDVRARGAELRALFPT